MTEHADALIDAAMSAAVHCSNNIPAVRMLPGAGLFTSHCAPPNTAKKQGSSELPNLFLLGKHNVEHFKLLQHCW